MCSKSCLGKSWVFYPQVPRREAERGREKRWPLGQDHVGREPMAVLSSRCPAGLAREADKNLTAPSGESALRHDNEPNRTFITKPKWKPSRGLASYFLSHAPVIGKEQGLVVPK